MPDSVFMQLAQSLNGTTPEKAPQPELAATPVAADAPLEEAQKNAPKQDKAEQGGNEAGETGEQTFPVMIDGQEVQVPLSQLLAGHQRHSDYTKKVMALAEERKAAEAKAAEVTQIREQYGQRLDALVMAQKPNLPTPEQMNAALAENRIADYLSMQQAHQRFQFIQSEQARVQQETETEKQRTLAATQDNERQKLLDVFPEWKTDHHGASRLQRFLSDQGFSDNDIAATSDHRHFMLAEYARRYLELQAKRPEAEKKVANVPQVGRPGARQDVKAGQDARLTGLKQTIQKTGSSRALREYFAETFKS